MADAKEPEQPSVDSVCVETFQQLKVRKKFRYILFKVNGVKIEVDATGDTSKSFDDFLKALPDSQCRYAVFDKEYESADGRAMDKLYFLTWMPAVCQAPTKMMYTSERKRIRNLLDGVFDASAVNRDEVRRQFEMSKPLSSKGKADCSDDEEEEEWDPDA